MGDPAGLFALDVGCGVGLTDRHLTGQFGSLTGTDVSPGVLETAASDNPGVRYELADRDRLPFEDGEFDLAFAVCVVQVLPPAERPRFVAELARVTRPDGLVVVFEHNPYNPLTRLVVRRCEFGEDARMLRMGEAERLLQRERDGSRSIAASCSSSHRAAGASSPPSERFAGFRWAPSTTSRCGARS